MSLASRRRGFLKAGAFGLLGATAWSAPSAQPNRSCILVYLLGGPPHLDTFDLKPPAPAEVRGPFQPIATSLNGLRICEHLPRLAKLAHRYSLLRSVSYPNNDHPFMIYYTLTGRISPVPLGENTVLPPSRTDYPHLGAVVAKFAHRRRELPGYVAIPEVRVRMAAMPVSGGGRAGFLGPANDPLAINDDPLRPLPALGLPADVSSSRFGQRQALLAELSGARGSRSRLIEEHEEFRRSASRLVQTTAKQDLFDLEREPQRLRERYGIHRFGQSLLLARRLSEAGVSLSAVHFNYMSKCDGWDTHSKNFECLKGELLPLLDQSLSALLEDLHQRGRLDDTLVVCMGEFGRTPKINGNAGRDHWGHCASVLLAGGGVQGGRVIGSSDQQGAYPRDWPFDPTDVQATIYHSLGLDPQQEMRDQLARPLPLSTGKVIQQLF
jgi:hypothetical protein